MKVTGQSGNRSQLRGFKMMKSFVFLLATSTMMFSAENAPSKKTVVAAVVSSGPELGFKPAEMFVGKLNTELVRFVSIRQSLLSNFDKMYDSEVEIVGQAITTYKADKLLVGRMNYSFRMSKLMENHVVCDLTFGYKVMSKNGDVLNQGVLLQVGAGFSNETAMEAALDRLAREFRP